MPTASSIGLACGSAIAQRVPRAPAPRSRPFALDALGRSSSMGDVARAWMAMLLRGPGSSWSEGPSISKASGEIEGFSRLARALQVSAACRASVLRCRPGGRAGSGSTPPAGTRSALRLGRRIEKMVDLGPVAPRLRPVTQPGEIATIASRDLAEGPAVEDPEVEDGARRPARRRPRGAEPERLRAVVGSVPASRPIGGRRGPTALGRARIDL